MGEELNVTREGGQGLHTTSICICTQCTEYPSKAIYDCPSFNHLSCTDGLENDQENDTSASTC